MGSNREVEWNAIVKPILASSYGSFNKNDLPEFIRSIVTSEDNIVDHAAEYDTFYSTFVLLAADYITQKLTDLPVNQVSSACDAARVLGAHMLRALEPGGGQHASPLSRAQLIDGLHMLCQGGALEHSDHVTLVAAMKMAKLPPHILTTTPNKPDDGSFKCDQKSRARQHGATLVLDHLSSLMFGSTAAVHTAANDDTDNEATPTAGSQVKSLFYERNAVALQLLNACDTLVQMCQSLPHLGRYLNRYSEYVTSGQLQLPASLSDAMNVRSSLQTLCADVTMVWRAVSLPLLEPLTAPLQTALVTLSGGCLLAALTVATACSVGQEEVESQAVDVVVRALEVYETVLNAMRNSSRCGGPAVQGLQMSAARLLFCGLLAFMQCVTAMGDKQERGKSPVKSREIRVIPSKVQQGLTVLMVALSSQALSCFSNLLTDVSPEALVFFQSPPAADDASCLLPGYSLTQLLIILATTSYRKAVSLHGKSGGASTAKAGGAAAGALNTTFIDDSGGEEPGSDDESGSLLGQWLTRTLNPPESGLASPLRGAAADSSAAPAAVLIHKSDWQTETSLVPERGDPRGYLSLSAHVLRVLNSELLDTRYEPVRRYLQANINEQQLAMLAAMVRDVETGVVWKGGASTEKLYRELGSALTRLTHNLVASRLLTNQLQATLLSQLGVSPWSDDPLADWPLHVRHRSLLLLAQVLLLRPVEEQETAVSGLWNRLIGTLTRRILNVDGTAAPVDTDADDLNVEHAQLLLFLFHSLQLMQKKSVLHLCASAVVKVAAVLDGPMSTGQILLLSRLLALLEYIVHNLYETPAYLIEQVKCNLFSGGGCGVEPLYISCDEVERSVAEAVSDGTAAPMDSTPPSCYYTLTHNNLLSGDPARLDGLACIFLLCPPGYLDYEQFYGSLVSLLRIGDQPHLISTVQSAPPSVHQLASTHYCFNLVWRLCVSLPPSIEFWETMAGDDDAEPSSAVDDYPRLLLSLLWLPRVGHKLHTHTTRDALLKKGVPQSRVDRLLQSATLQSQDCGRQLQLLRRLSQVLRHDDTDSQQLPPRFLHLLTLHAHLATVQMCSDDMLARRCELDRVAEIVSSSETPDSDSQQLVQPLLDVLLQLISDVAHHLRWSIVSDLGDVEGGESADQRLAYYHLLQFISLRAESQFPLADACLSSLPPAISTRLLHRTASVADRTVHSPSTWKTRFSDHALPSEGYMNSIVMGHSSTLPLAPAHRTEAALKQLLLSLVCLAETLYNECIGDDSVRSRISSALLPLALDASCQSSLQGCDLDSLVGTADSDQYRRACCSLVVLHVCKILELQTRNIELAGTISEECVQFLEGMLDSAAGRTALVELDRQGGSLLLTLLLSAGSDRVSVAYGVYVLKFCHELFQAADRSENSELRLLCASLDGLADLPADGLRKWLSRLVMSLSADTSSPAVPRLEQRVESQQLLQQITTYLVREDSAVGHRVPRILLETMISIGGELFVPGRVSASHGGLLQAMAALASVGSGHGQLQLFTSCVKWLIACKSYLCEKYVLDKLMDGVMAGRHGDVLEFTQALLAYIGDVVTALKLLGDHWRLPHLLGSTSPAPDGDVSAEPDSDWLEDAADDDSDCDDSDEDSLNNKLCTFTMTQREYMNQHWYHCHTCGMVDSVGACSVCVRVCHRGHDISYAKHGSFFCDCGAREDGSCQALVKRSRQPQQLEATAAGSSSATAATIRSATYTAESMLHSLLRRRTSGVPTVTADHQLSDRRHEEQLRRRQTLARQLEPLREALQAVVWRYDLVDCVLQLAGQLLPAARAGCARVSPIGAHGRAAVALQQLHTLEKKFDNSDTLMLPTLGSQEGAFDNVRMTFSGEQGQTIRQLISAHMIRRVAMCCLSAPQGRRQHLAVSHEKGKIAVLQLSALLKQSEAAKRKLTLTRLASAPMPFTVLSIASNPCNEDVLAVCGLKDCHVLTFSSSGSVSDHLVLQPQLEAGNFIINGVWMPGSQTALALVTADFVKLYQLSQDVLSPCHYLLLPSGKIRDTCLVRLQDDTEHLVIMSSTGLIYTVEINDDSSSKHGPFYVTNILDFKHPEIKWSNGHICGGGVSIYFSHALQMLFFSFSQGKSFFAPLLSVSSSLENVQQIQLKPSGSGKPNWQPLCQWSEVLGHPGLVAAMTQSSSNPVLLMLRPDSVTVQEIRIVPTKSKITDMVLIRHSTTNSAEKRTTLIVLCEDGSLRIYMANPETTGFWLSPSLSPTSVMSLQRPAQKKAPKPSRAAGLVHFPPDFFESCSLLTDVEYGGTDVLQVYNTQQLKHRLNTSGLYVACTKPGGFSIDVTNNDQSMVICGVRVLVGTQEPQRAPAFLELLCRNVPLQCTRSRWFDVPLTREESLQTDRRLTLLFGPSQDPASVVMVDSIKLYGKTKESFEWPDDCDDALTSPPAATTASVSAAGGEAAAAARPVAPLDRLLCCCLETLDGCMVSCAESSPLRPAVLQLCTDTLQLDVPVSAGVSAQAESLLAVLHGSRAAYHSYKDQFRMGHVWSVLRRLNDVESADSLDSELFHHLVVACRSLALSRPASLVKNTASPTTDDGAPTADGFIGLLVTLFWRLHDARPSNPLTAPVCTPGLTQVEPCVYALCDVLYAYMMSDSSTVPVITETLSTLLLSDSLTVSFATRHGLMRVLRPKLRRRRVYIPSPPVCSTAGGGSAPIERTAAGRPIRAAAPAAAAAAAPLQQHPPPEALEEEELVDDDDDDLDMESLLAQAQGLPLDLPPEADDEAMVELAIALSLQDQDSGAPALQNLRHHLQGLVGIEPNMGAQQLENLLDDGGAAAVTEPVERPSAAAPSEGHLSDTTASAPGSDDDEGSTAATDGSTLRTSPAEQAGSGGSESGASGVDSIAGEHLSARSSVYGDGTQESVTIARSETSSIGAPVSVYQPAVSEDSDTDLSGRLHALRVELLERLLTYLPRVSQGSGVCAIPFFQVLLMLASDLDGSTERDRLCLDKLLKMLLTHLRLEDADAAQQERGVSNEMNVVVMRMLSVLMSRPKSMLCSRQSDESAALIASSTAAALLQADTLTHCLHTLQHFLPHWKQSEADKDGTVVGGKLLKERCVSPVLDMSPFFLKDYVKRYGLEVFSTYPHLLTEMALRLPYQVKKGVSASVSSNGSPLSLHVWQQTLCQYMMAPLTPFVRRQVRKLLLDLCGNKESYRQLRDLHMLHTHIQALRSLCGEDSPLEPAEPSSGSQQEGKLRDSVLYLGYNSLIEVVERLRSCQEVASSRTVNWQKFCASDDTVLSFLVHTSYRLAEGVAPIILQLLQLAAVQLNTSSSQLSTSSSISCSSATANKSSTSVGSGKSAQQQSSLSSVLTKQLISLQSSSPDTMNRFIRTFLLDSNTVSTRWHCHALLLSIWRGSSVSDKLVLVEVLWKLWPLLPSYGRKAAQFVDILGYVSLKTDQAENMVCSYTERAVEMLRTQNQLLAGHANGQLYSGLSSLVQFDGYYLESEPCLVCNSPELPMTQIKLSGAKVDSRHTTTTQLVKLSGMHTISRITLRIADLKRSKMVRTINILYSNRTVQSVVELKNRPSIWHKAKKVTLTAGQTDVKLDFSLPIVACNLMIEYSSFYENMQASSETLQCPRCSANVPAHPGVCGNCGENVYQCHKCRAINYDEKDPFLCNACGFCKYGKFEYVLTARPCCAVDPIESEEDRKKAVAGINNYLDQADKIYRKLMSYKPSLETLLDWVTDHGGDASATTSIAAANTTTAPPAAVPNNAAAAASSSHVSRPIQQLAQKYCTDCKLAFDELSAVIQKVLASRRELLRYDTQSSDDTASSTAAYYQETTSHGRCYGCSSAAALSCVTLLRALATNPRLRTTLCNYGLLPQLLEHNLRRGPAQGRDEVCQLLCLLTKDNLPATLELNSLISERIQSSLSGSLTPSAFASAVRHEMALLQTAALKEDSCWEHRLRCVLGIFILANKERSSPVVMEAVTLPCLRVLQRVMQPPVPPATPAAAGSTAAAQQHIAPARLAVTATVGTVGGALAAELDVNAARWLSHDNPHSFLAWRTHKHKLSAVARSADTARGQPAPARSLYLMDKYGSRWRRRTTQASISVTFLEASWLRRVIFNPCSRQARQMAADMAETLANEPVRKRKILDMLTGFLSDVIHAGEAAAEFLALFKKLMTGWKCYLASMGALSLLGGLITQEIEELNKLEETTLSSDLSQGYALKELTELMACLLDVDSVRDRYKSPLLGTVLHGYLSLRRLVIQRTKLVDETQDRLLQLLEDIISGNEAETRLFMSICVDYLAQCPLSDMRTPEFILERLCSTIKPEVNEVGPFMLSLEKDPQQEDFLQGRMAGNPYSSNDAGMGPLMRDVKNRICTDCELVALLEDDTGMELLVNSKIISLDLPVKQVYRRVWLPTATSEADPMRVVYRMRGLLGDATEEFIESLESNSNRDEDDEQTYKLASVMSECNGLQELLRRMERIEDLRRHGPLLCVLLRLMGLCIKTRQNRVTLISPQLRAVSVMLALLGRCLQEQLVAGPLTEQLLLLLEAVLSEAGSLPPEQFQLFADTCGTADDITLLLDHVTSTQRKPVGGVVQRLMRVLPFLTFGCDDKMRLLIERFLPVLEFDAYDAQPLPETAALLDACCALTEGIEHNSQGGRLKELLAGHGVLERALSYLQRHAPPGQRALLHSGDEQWRGFLQRPALHYVLRLLAGLAARHPPSQLAVAADSIPIIHRLEQVSSEQHVGTLAENLLEALRTNAEVASKIELVRKQTRQEKKRLAMAMRQHQLGALGMRANDKGQVVISSSVLKQLDSFTEETGLTCVICREGYKFQPTKVLGIYTFSKRCPLDEAEPRQRKTTGYTTVSHFNLVHIDCHMAAVRLARARDEWESAALQNANTRCNGLLPLWGPQVAESAFAHCLARHNTYLQEATGHRDVNYQTTVHDLKLLLLRLAQQRSLSQDSGGGGPQSNISLLPYMAHMALYVINTTRVAQRQAGSVQAQLVQTPAELWVESSFETDGPLYWCAMALLVTSADSWRRRTRVAALRRLLVLAHARHVLPAGGRALPAEHRQPLPYAVYQPYLLFLGLLDGLYTLVVPVAAEDADWSQTLAEYIRQNDQLLLDGCDALLRHYQSRLLMADSLADILEAMQLQQDVPDPQQFLHDTLQQTP